MPTDMPLDPTADRCVRSIPGREDLEGRLLRVVAEQVAMRVDQIARYLKVSEEVVGSVVDALVERGTVRVEEVMVGEPRWVWLRSSGSTLAGMGFFYKRPVLWGVRHRAAVNEVRLWLEDRASGSRWVPERAVRGPRAGLAHVPDGVLEVDGERHAIEVELTKKSPARVREVIAEHSVRYDAVVFFCGEGILGWMEALVAELPGAAVAVRSLPGEHLTPGLCYEGTREEVWPLPGEVPLLAFVTEQGAAPVDQISRYLRIGLSEAEVLVESLCRRGFLCCHEALVGEPRWAWSTERGAHCSETGLARMAVSVGSVERLRLVNEIRLWIRARSPEARWVGRRELIACRPPGARAAVPKAVVEEGGERVAIDAALGARAGQVLPRLARLGEEYDGVICFVGSGSLDGYREAVRARGLGNVRIDDATPLGASRRGASVYWAPALERELLWLVNEHGVCSEQQIARLMCLDRLQAEAMVGYLEEQGMLRRGGSGWNFDGLVSCTTRGVSRGGSDLQMYTPPRAVVGLREAEALVEAYIGWRDAGGGGEWVTKRRALKGKGRAGHVRGLLRRDEGTWAVEVFFAEHRRDRRIVADRLARALAGYDGVLVFCAREMVERVEEIVAEMGCVGAVELRLLPGGSRWSRVDRSVTVS
jgi:hypothetical protein